MPEISPRISQRKSARLALAEREMMLSDPDVQRWHANLARGSQLTADGRLRRLRRFCQAHRITPKRLADLAMTDLRAATDLLEDHITMMTPEGYAPGYIEEQVKTVKSWLGHFEVVVRRKLKVGSTARTPTLANERVPDAQEMRDLYDRAGLRVSAIIALMGGSGLKPEVGGTHDGSDGLRLADLPDLAVRGERVGAVREPCMVVARPELSKTRHRYFTFSGRIAAARIIAYLNDRLEAGEALNESSSVIAPDRTIRAHRGNNSGKAFLVTPQISHLVRQAIRRTFGENRKMRPYALRAYFASQMLVAEARGLIAHDFHVFHMGHTGGMQSRYTTHKGVLPDVMVAEMRAAFQRAEYLLEPASESRAEQESRPSAGAAVPPKEAGQDAAGRRR